MKEREVSKDRLAPLERTGVPFSGGGYTLKGNREMCARILDMGERTLYRKIKEYGLWWRGVKLWRDRSADLALT